MSEIESKVKAIIVDKLGVDEAEVKPEASFTNDLGADSLDTVELIMEFEKEFSISIPDDKAEKIKVTIMSEIESKVKAIIVDKLGVDEAEVKPEASFTNDLGADSLDTVELIMEFEKEFSISIPDDKAEKIATVGDAISYIEENAK